MAEILAGAKNWVTNPSFEINLGGWDSTGVSNFIRVDNEQWVGDYCAKATKNGTTSYITLSNTNRVHVETADNCVYAIRVKSESSSNWAYIETVFYNSSGAVTHSIDHPEVQLSTDWTTLTAADAAQAGDVETNIRVHYGTNLVNGEFLWFDGCEIRRNEQLDTYIDGDQGSIYTWSGAAHDSTSTRSAVEEKVSIGTGGVIHMTAKLYRSNKSGERLEDISEDLIEGEVTFSADAEVHMNFTAKIRDITELSAYEDYVIPVLRLQYAGGSITEEQVGHYIVVPSTRRYSQASTEGTVDGRGLEWLLTMDEYSKGYSIPAGGDFAQEVRNCLNQAGIKKFNVPNSGKTVPKKRTWEPGTKRIKVINDLLDSAGYHPIHMARDGRLTSFKIPYVKHAEPAVMYDTGSRSDIVGVVTETPDMENFANRMVVIAEDAERDTIRVILRNDNQASPVSIPRLGFTKTKTHTSKNLNNAADARELGQRMLERAARHLVKLEIETLPDPTRNPYEVYTLRIKQDNDRYIAFGNYACTSWRLGFSPQQGSMKHTVERLEIYE